MQSSDFTNIPLFDCRRYIRPGDMIWYDSMFACPTADSVQRHSSIPHCAMVTAVYEKFVVVKLQKTVESVNRWNIISVNNRPFKRGSVDRAGCFSALKVRA